MLVEHQEQQPSQDLNGSCKQHDPRSSFFGPHVHPAGYRSRAPHPNSKPIEHVYPIVHSNCNVFDSTVYCRTSRELIPRFQLFFRLIHSSIFSLQVWSRCCRLLQHLVEIFIFKQKTSNWKKKKRKKREEMTSFE